MTDEEAFRRWRSMLELNIGQYPHRGWLGCIGDRYRPSFEDQFQHFLFVDERTHSVVTGEPLTPAEQLECADLRRAMLDARADLPWRGRHPGGLRAALEALDSNLRDHGFWDPRPDNSRTVQSQPWEGMWQAT